MSRATGRTRADDLLAASLAAGRTVAESATSAGVSEATAYRRLTEQDFQARVRGIRGEMVAAAAGQLASAMTEAATVLRQLLSSESEGIRLKAAVELLNQCVKLVELTELQQRVADLERHLDQQQRRGRS